MLRSLRNVFVAGTIVLTFSQSTFAESISKNERVLIVVSELDSSGIPELAPLYRVLEDLTDHTVSALLQDKYRNIISLKDSAATPERLKQTLFAQANRPEIKAIDMIISLHGSPNKLTFSNGAITKEGLKDYIMTTSTRSELVTKFHIKKKLRALYNLACYGGKNMVHLKDLGFAVVNGARGVNANSEVETVPALTAWANGAGFKAAFSASNNPVALGISDIAIREAGRAANNALQETDSEKLFSGETGMTINSSPL